MKILASITNFFSRFRKKAAEPTVLADLVDVTPTYKDAQRRTEAGLREAILTPPPSATNSAVMIGRDVYVAGVNQYGKPAGWVKKKRAGA